MAYSDAIRSSQATLETVADTIDNIFTSSGPTLGTNYSPSYGAGGSMTWSPSTGAAKYVLFGNVCWVYVSTSSGTTGGTASDNLTITLPFNSATGKGFYCQIEHGGSNWISGCMLISTATATIYKYDNSDYSLGTVNVVMNGFYYV